MSFDDEGEQGGAGNLEQRVWDARTDPLLRDVLNDSREGLTAPSFTTVRRGYEPREVDEFVTEAIARIRLLAQGGGRPEPEDRDAARAELERRVAELQQRADRAAQLETELQQLREEASRLTAVEAELSEARQEAQRAARLERDLESAKTQLDRLLEERAKPDAYGSLANQVADLLRSAGIQADQIRREADEEARRQLDEAAAEADSIRREAQREADEVRRTAAAEAERVSTERDEILLAARQDAERQQREGQEEATRVLREANAEAAAIRRDVAEEAESVRREANAEAESLRRDAQAAAERMISERDEVLREARSDAERQVAEATLEAGRLTEEAQRTLRTARADAERLVSAAISRREIVLAELTTMRERLKSSIELLETAMEPVAAQVAAAFPAEVAEDEDREAGAAEVDGSTDTGSEEAVVEVSEAPASLEQSDLSVDVAPAGEGDGEDDSTAAKGNRRALPE